MQFSSLGSGSKGNGTLVRHGDCVLLIDCGFTLKETVKRLARLQVSPEQLDAVIVTHEHSDHIGGVGPLARKYKVPVYMTPGTYRSRDIGKLPKLELIKSYKPFTIQSIGITPVAVPHDAAEPAQYIFSTNTARLGILTDLGSITPHVEMHYHLCDGLVLEANHDSLMLASGQYPPTLKQRVGGAWGHLNNRQAADFLTRIDCSKLKQLVVAHISQQNNSLELAREAFDDINLPLNDIRYACQDQGFDWISLDNTGSDTLGSTEQKTVASML
ncbi:MAG: MBL fold metallo-hydrolase [Cellvibrionaceae bacterium]